MAYTLHTFHWIDDHEQERLITFPTFDMAKDYALAHDPDTDGSLLPSGGEALFDHPHFEASVRWFGNPFAVITQGE
jgi:hypothetical protein